MAKAKAASAKREFDLVVYGAASFVGRLLVRYLVERHGVDGDLKWALAGRNESKLKAVASEFGAQSLPLIIADAHEIAALNSMAMRSKVIVTTVGPYALFGSDLVAACAEQGTHYCDLTGEAQWMRLMIDAHENTAKRTGARIVHNCGFDSIPSDMGVWFSQSEAQKSFNEPCQQIKMRVKAAKGGASGGTVASMMNMVDEVKRDPAIRQLMQNPYAVAPEGMRRGVRQPNVTAPTFDKDANSWLAPFVMAGINTRVVHRSHGLLGRPWGDNFLYDEAMLMGSGPAGAMRAAAVTAGLGGFIALSALKPTRALLNKTVLPQPGEGPSPKAQKEGYYDLRFFGRTASGKTLQTKVTGAGDPGYGSTAKMLGEAAVCLAKDDLAVEGGFWTPSTAMGDTLIERLRQHADVCFERLS